MSTSCWSAPVKSLAVEDSSISVLQSLLRAVDITPSEMRAILSDLGDVSLGDRICELYGSGRR
eukprot:CAMPEP_0119328544 /NCGR_PEP_ID=MMETSP1333-20130426/73581_1 /TAXON_ID=418940 /ORGANISM="Scyphosphaera apsteinii, Strain RCC1455" /LENGTH=62 /DNA_ID=CAMNT_0007337425 /DNA_START=428 /DNA_END=616 /DNA_ORIENTATION=+